MENKKQDLKVNKKVFIIASVIVALIICCLVCTVVLLLSQSYNDNLITGEKVTEDELNGSVVDTPEPTLEPTVAEEPEPETLTFTHEYYPEFRLEYPKEWIVSISETDKSENIKYNGNSVGTLNLVFEKSGINVNYTLYPFTIGGWGPADCYKPGQLEYKVLDDTWTRIEKFPDGYDVEPNTFFYTNSMSFPGEDGFDNNYIFNDEYQDHENPQDYEVCGYVGTGAPLLTESNIIYKLGEEVGDASGLISINLTYSDSLDNLILEEAENIILSTKWQ